jgi:hypothetical protein
MGKLNKKFVSAAVLAAGIAGLAVGQAVLQQKAEAQGASVQAPRFVVDPLWPKPLPNNWLLGWTIGVWVDEQDYVWIVHRGAGGLHNNEKGAELDPPIAECCRTAPPILVFDPAGNLVRHWGGPGQGYEWPQSNHGVHVDYKGNVWIGGNGEKDAHILKFTKDGKFLMQVGHFGGNAGSNDQENFGRVAKIWVDPKTNEATSRMTPTSGRTIRRRRRSPSSAIRCTASSARTTGWSTCATGRTTACRCFSRTASSSRKRSTPATPRVPARCGTSPSRGIRTRNSCSSPTARTSASA